MASPRSGPRSARTAAGPVPAVPVPAGYVALCLRLRRLVPDLVSVVAVDEGLRRTVAAEPVPTAADLVRDAGRLAAALPDAGLAPARERYLAAQLRAVEWKARRLAGQGVPFAREVRECLDGVDRPDAPGEPDAYRAAHRALADLLPGSGSLAARMAAHRRRDAVPADRLGPAVTALTAALRDRVAAAYDLPVGESVACRVVPEAPWRALHIYRGGSRSLVRFAAGAGAGRLPRLVAHESYPGHHVECCRAEVAAAGRADDTVAGRADDTVAGRADDTAAAGRVELGVGVLGTPATVVSEGLAECGLDVAAGPGWGPWAAAVLATAGVVTDGELAERLEAVRAVLRPVRLDAALLLHGGPPGTGGLPGADARAAAEAHLRRWLLLDEARARRVADVLARPLWRTQVVAAVRGTELVGAWLRRPDPVAEHRRLLDDPLTPRALCVRTGTESRRNDDGR